ncbi:MAG: hypothetical protein ABL907_20165 [Hyphomicrobium sp.]
MSRGAFDHLPDFAADGEGHPGVGVRQVFDALAHREAMDEALSEAYVRGFAAGVEDRNADAVARLDQARADFERQIAEERAIWRDEVSSRLVEEIAGSRSAIVAQVTDVCAEVLAPLVHRQLRAEAETAFFKAVEKAVYDGVTVSVSGQREFVARVQDLLSAQGIIAECQGSDQPDVAVKIDQTTIRTAFDDWYAALEGQAV